jgi:ribulose-phosphate 3-epimerase
MDYLDMRGDLETLRHLGIDRLHYDICDSYFVPEFGLPFYLIRKLVEYSGFPSDYHLMVEEPKRIYEFIPKEESAEDRPRVSVHYEACRNLHRELVALRRMGFSPGLVINPATTLSHIEYVIEEVNQVTIMTVNPGFPSQEIIPQTITKIERLRQWRDRAGYDLDVAVDGNVSFDNIPRMVAAGASALVLGTSGLFVPDRPLQASYEQLKEAIDKGTTLAATQ